MPAKESFSEFKAALRMSENMFVFGFSENFWKHSSSSRIKKVSEDDGNFKPPLVFNSTNSDSEDLFELSVSFAVQAGHEVNFESLCAT